MTDREQLNAPCPFCHMDCRIGMTHDCEAKSYYHVRLVRLANGDLVAQVYSGDDVA